ncbi:MAG: M12 family metallo-peptidase, partial [Candidatus Competibacter sp.]|nr:M12 family metallo-peptidase [Candidatus Competibacter sp.]
MQNRPFLVLLVSCLLAILPLPSSPAADGYLTAAAAVVTTSDIPELFVPDDGPTQQSRSKAAATLAGRYPVRINARLSETGLPPATVLLSAPNGVRYEVVQDNQILHASGGTTWVGHLKDHDDIYRVLVTTQQGHSFGRILTPDGEFLVESDDSGTWLLDTHEAGWLPANTYDDAIPSPSLASSRQLAPRSGEATVDSSISPKAAGNSIIDVMLLYTPDLATHYGAGLQAHLDSLIATANQAYLDSQVNISLRLVHHAQVSYSETASNTDALDALTYGSHPSLANVSAWRDQYGADLVALLRPFSMANHVGCGLSWLNGFNGQAMNAAYGFSVIGDGSDVGGSLYYCPDSSLVHELGHAMGSDHDRANSVAQGAYPYAYGYGVEGVFGTIMSYINPRIGKFSNPKINCLGNQPCGIEDYADNTRSLNNTRDSVAGFRNANANNDQIVLALEEPVGGTTYSGIA